MIHFYEINPAYIDYLAQFAPHLFRNKRAEQRNSRKYIGVVLTVSESDYFVPLSSFKEKHLNMRESVDFIKIKKYAVLNLNNMFPAPESERTFVDINKIQDLNYRNLLRNEYRAIKVLEKKILKTRELSAPIKFGTETKRTSAKDAMTSFCWKKKRKCI